MESKLILGAAAIAGTNYFVYPTWHAAAVFSVVITAWVSEKCLRLYQDNKRIVGEMLSAEQRIKAFMMSQEFGLNDIKVELKTLRAASGLRSTMRPNTHL